MFNENGYIDQNWSPGDVITATAMNDIEHGVADVVLIQDEDPTTEGGNTYQNGVYNKIWVQPEVTQIQIPTCEELYDTYPVNTASGNPTYFSDGANNVPVKALTVDIKPAQAAGTPTPEAPLPISGWTSVRIHRSGKNLWPDTYDPVPVRAPYYKPVFVGNNTVTLSTTMPRNTTNSCNLFLLAGSVTEGANTAYNGVDVNAPRTVSAIDGYVTVCYRNADGEDPRDYNVQLEFGNTATTFEAYKATDEYSITFPTEAGVVSGGTVDVTNGLLTVDRVMVTLDGSETWSMNGSNESGFICNTPISISKLSANSYTSDIVSNMFTIVGNSSVASPSTTTTGIPSGGGSPLLLYFYLRYDFVANIDAWKAWLATHNVQVSYLIEPNSYQLGPVEIQTLLGENIFYTNGDDISVIYHVNTKQFLDSNYVGIDDYNDKNDQINAKLLALLKKNITDSTINNYTIKSICTIMGFADTLYFYNHKNINVNTGEIKQATEIIPASTLYNVYGATDYITIGAQLNFSISKDMPYDCYCYDTDKQYLGRANITNLSSSYDEIQCLDNTQYIRLTFYIPSRNLDQLLKSVHGSLVIINNKKYCYVETTYDE